MLAELERTLFAGHTAKEEETWAYVLSDPLFGVSFRISKICIDGCWLGKYVGFVKDTVNWTLVVFITYVDDSVASYWLRAELNANSMLPVLLMTFPGYSLTTKISETTEF